MQSVDAQAVQSAGAQALQREAHRWRKERAHVWYKAAERQGVRVLPSSAYGKVRRKISLSAFRVAAKNVKNFFAPQRENC